ncbi:trinucleotide repeat containing 6A isoform 2 isoform 3-like protein [Camelus ferus]|nr:trinucleotide repeat containing 6A isoform 2 isoform 3-like protein [Camelus ferus]
MTMLNQLYQLQLVSGQSGRAAGLGRRRGPAPARWQGQQLPPHAVHAGGVPAVPLKCVHYSLWVVSPSSVISRPLVIAVSRVGRLGLLDRPEPQNPEHQAYQRLQIQQQMLQAQRNVSGPMRQQEQQTKEQQSSPNTFAPYPLAGLNPNMNVNSMDMTGGLSVKDPSQSQSRLPQWTHPNPMDSLPGAASPLDQNPSKHGAIPGGLSIGPPAKSSIDDSYGRYDLIQSSESPASPPVAVPHSWSRAKSDSDKISNGSSINWPPEFHPGVPWKGLQNIDPENDPDVTPGSVPTGPTINTTIQDVNRYLLKSGEPDGHPWSPGTQGFAGHLRLCMQVLSQVPWSPGTQGFAGHLRLCMQVLSRDTGSLGARSSPPSSQNATLPSSSAWPLGASGHSRALSSIAPAPSIAGSAWSTDTSGRTSSWLVLRNLTPQIDGSTLRTLCLQHGPLITFHLNLTQGNAVVRYSSKEEAAKAQKSLHMYVAPLPSAAPCCTLAVLGPGPGLEVSDTRREERREGLRCSLDIALPCLRGSRG